MNLEELNLLVDDGYDRMEKAVDALANAFNQIRSGRATTAMVDDIRVEVYGQEMPINQIASINIPEARMIVIDVWDKSNLGKVEKAIMKSGRNINPQNDGNIIRINLPDMSEETRREMVKLAKHKVEDYKVSVRNIRRDLNDHIKKVKEGVSEDEIRNLQDKVQKTTDDFIHRMDKMLATKEKEIMAVG